MRLQEDDKYARKAHHQPEDGAETMTPKSESNQGTEVSLSETLRREALGREERRS